MDRLPERRRDGALRQADGLARRVSKRAVYHRCVWVRDARRVSDSVLRRCGQGWRLPGPRTSKETIMSVAARRAYVKGEAVTVTTAIVTLKSLLSGAAFQTNANVVGIFN